MSKRKRIGSFDPQVLPTNPIGGCHLRMLRAPGREHDSTVFAVQFENPGNAVERGGAGVGVSRGRLTSPRARSGSARRPRTRGP